MWHGFMADKSALQTTRQKLGVFSGKEKRAIDKRISEINQELNNLLVIVLGERLTVDIFENPFYILGAAPQDNRRRLSALAEGKALLLDADLVAEARGVLTTPSKRLNAEIRWFPGVSSEDATEIADYCIALKTGRNAVEPELLDAGMLADLNIKLYSFPFKPFADFFQLKYAVLEISRLFADIDIDNLIDEINKDRTTAGFSMINTTGELEDALRDYRNDLRKTISTRLSELPKRDYVELITLLAEKYSSANDRYSGHAVLEDIVSDYELQMMPEIDGQKQQIIEMASFIEKGAAEIRIHDAVGDIIASVTAWDALAQPLQLVSQGRGQKHEASEEIAHSIRELAVALHNDYGETEEALRLTEALKRSFAELPDFAERIDDDARTLYRLKRENEDNEKAQEVLSGIEAIKKAAYSLKLSVTSTSVEEFISRVKKLDAQIKALNIDADLCTKLRENLCYTARESAINLHNDRQETSFALTLATALLNQFHDIPTLKAKLTDDVSTLTQQSAELQARNAHQKSENIGCLVVIGIIVLIVILSSIGHGSNSGSNMSAPNNASNTTASTETVFSNSSTSGTKVYANIVSIWPAIGIYTESSSNYSNFVCECKTSAGTTVWVYMTVTEYKNNFDSSASASVSAAYADEVTYSTAVKIHGTVKKADNIMSGLSSDTATMVIDFSSLDD